MADVERLLSQYIEEHRSGGRADAVEYLDQLEGTDREELAALIDAYLVRSPGQAWDAEAFHGSDAEILTARLARSFGSRAGLWPVVLPRLRERAQVMRADLVKRLASALGVEGKAEKVEGYYHEMEQGLLPSQGVDDSVLAKLGEILGTSAEFLRRAGESISEGEAPGQGTPVFTRIATADTTEVAAAGPAPAAAHTEESAEWDEVDALFRGRRG